MQIIVQCKEKNRIVVRHFLFLQVSNNSNWSCKVLTQNFTRNLLVVSIVESKDKDIWVSLNIFTKFIKFSTAYLWNIIRACNLWCKGSRFYHTTNKTHVTNMILKSTPVHASVIYQIPWI